MKTNVVVNKSPVYTHEGGKASRISPEQELRRTVLNCLLGEDAFYEEGDKIAARIADLVKMVDPAVVAGLAIIAREQWNLRHVPLFLIRELARRKGCGSLVASVLPRIIRRPDEITEFLALYWKETPRQTKIAAAIKRGLAVAFTKFGEYEFAKYNRTGAQVTLRAAMRLVHPRPHGLVRSNTKWGGNPDTPFMSGPGGTLYEAIPQSELFRRIVEDELTPPDTWEVALSAGKDKKETFERLLRENKLGGMALLQNLRNMVGVGVDELLIRQALEKGVGKAFPHRFITAEKYAPFLQDSLEKAMFSSIEKYETLMGKTGILVDVSASMESLLSARSETTRMDAASALTVLLREKCPIVAVATFSQEVRKVLPYRGLALCTAITTSQPHNTTYLSRALETLFADPEWTNHMQRVIVITDEQSADGIVRPISSLRHAYIINVAPFAHGVGYADGWCHINGWSENILEYINEIEKEER